MRSTKECQKRRKSTLCSPSTYCPARGATGFSEFEGPIVPVTDCAGSITAKCRLEAYTKKCARKGEGAKTFQLKNAFPDGDGIARLDKKTSAASLGEALCIDLENLVATPLMSSHGDSFWRSDARISAGQGDRFQ
jgi:hypothetical protein